MQEVFVVSGPEVRSTTNCSELAVKFEVLW